MRPTDPPWWHRAIIYTVYLRSAADGNGDGIGDLLGLRKRLSYFADLGVDALWLSPIYPSGGVDGGYDVTDYDSVDPLYGGMEAFDAFLAEAHGLGLKVLLDFVPSHTSDRHPWFVEARSSRNSQKRDWYVWADPRGGEPPNNWPSAFGGPAWTYDEASGQYYLTTFYPQQVDLNWRNPEVRARVISSMRSWIERGVDGFRVDAVMRLAKDPGLRDNPLQTGEEEGWEGRALLNNQNHSDVHGFVREMRGVLGSGACLLGEVWHLDLRKVFKYLRPGELDLAFNFPFALAPWQAEAKGAAIELAEALAAETGAWPCYHLSNHDDSRHASLIGEENVPAAALLLLTLRGTAVLYLGEEIGMKDVEVPTEQRRDQMGRDRVRTPMQWDTSRHAGFCPSDVEPWLPLAPDHERQNVLAQAADPDSILRLYRRLLRLRRSSPALQTGSFRRIPAPADVLTYVREADSERVLVVVNFAPNAAEIEVPYGSVVVATNRRWEGERLEGSIRLEGHEALAMRVGE